MTPGIKQCSLHELIYTRYVTQLIEQILTVPIVYWSLCYSIMNVQRRYMCLCLIEWWLYCYVFPDFLKIILVLLEINRFMHTCTNMRMEGGKEMGKNEEVSELSEMWIITECCWQDKKHHKCLTHWKKSMMKRMTKTQN